MDFNSICKLKDYKDITRDIKEIVESHRWTSLVMPPGYGKTTLLSMLYYYFNIDENSYELFEDSALTDEWNEWDKYLNKHIVISLDFSDFNEDSYEDALRYIKDKMIRAYKQKLHLIMNEDDYKIRSYMNNLLHMDEAVFLRRSLESLLYFFYHGEYSRSNAVLLIDNLCMLEKKAREYDYYNEMRDFLTHYLSFEPDKSCLVYLQVGDEPAAGSTWNRDYFCYDPPFLPHSNRMYWRPKEDSKIYTQSLYEAEIISPEKNDCASIEKLMLKGEIIMLRVDNRQLENKKESRILSGYI